MKRSSLLKKVRTTLQKLEANKLRRAKYRSNKNPLAGHCYVACEVVKYLDKYSSHLQPQVARTPGGDTHWWLLDKRNGNRIDPTRDQFSADELEQIYSQGRGAAFLTKKPSKRAQQLMALMTNK